MKRQESLNLGSFVFAGLLAVTPAIAATESTEMGPLPPRQTQGSVTYMSGGIGQEEALAMRGEEGKFPLSLEFIKRAKPTDESLANVEVTITDPQGATHFRVIAEGPYLLADLPNGKYKVIAEFEGQSKSRDVVIAARKPERIVFEW